MCRVLAFQTRVLHAECLDPTLQFNKLCVYVLPTTLQSKMTVCAVCGDAAPGTVIWNAVNSRAVLNPRETPLILKCSIKQPHWGPFKVSVYSVTRPPISTIFAQRIKLSFASEPNLVLFYWLK